MGVGVDSRLVMDEQADRRGRRPAPDRHMEGPGWPFVPVTVDEDQQ